MKVYVNLTNVPISSEVTGIGRYVLNLLDGFEAFGVLKGFELFVNKESESMLLMRYPDVRVTVVPDLPLTQALGAKSDFFRIFFRDRFIIPLLLWRKEPGILFHPYSAMSVHVSKKHPTVVTVHDLYYKNFPEEHSKKMLKALDIFYRYIVHNSFRLIAPSNFVKDDIVRHFPNAEPNKIQVLHNPIKIRREKDQTYRLPEAYVLSINSLRTHKNIQTLVRAFARIEEEVEQWLVIVGTGDPKSHGIVKQTICSSGLRKVLLTGYLSEEQLNTCYRNASLFVSPSLHEGFGMTPVEAALYEVPVLTTRETSLPEVTQNLLHYYEPARDDIQLALRMIEILNQTIDRKALATIRRIYEKSYGHREVAARYLAYFDSLADGSGK